ncbi:MULTISPECIES: DsbA family protein [unclassified Pseudoalteromonas]|uniref:DsbA family protein n=1 Tax=unclassified Pseudoalteromonas TaxID=194690 RepID=UPI0005A85C64|nr:MULTISPECIES: DsbA family protein [unclassified Pseudoalteromonas]
MNRPTLFYIYDPMCSWCWGYKITWQKLQQFLDPLVDIEYKVGGLAPDSDAAMPMPMQGFLQSTWQKIEKDLGTEFNHDFWRNSTPKRSTYPSCRAVIIARDYQLETQMLEAIQKAYYLEAQNPSNNDVLIQLAKCLGIDKIEFEQKLKSDEINNKLISEINLIQKMPIQGFPSLVLHLDEQYYPIRIDYKNFNTTLEEIKSHL